MTDELDLILVGPYPPPFGGISVHIARLARGARTDGFTVGVVDHFGRGAEEPLIIAELRRNPWRYWRVLRTVRARVVHYHHARWSTLMASAWALRGSPAATVATVHGRELEPFLESRVPGVGALTRWALRSFDVLVAVSAEVERSLQAAVGHPVAMIPAYLPDEDDPGELSAEADAFLRQGRSLVMAAYRLSVDGRGRTLYGLETAIESFASVGRDHRDLRLAIFLASPPRSRREAQLLKGLVASAGDPDLRGRIRVFHGEPLAPALGLATLFLRPTVTDGDAVSIREAMTAGLPVLASDVVARPEGVTVLPLECSRWAGEIDRALRSNGAAVTASGSAADPLAQLLDIYDRLRPRPAPGAERILVG
jgi:glycosyltransferase involved in cell wall biosynthesis